MDEVVTEVDCVLYKRSSVSVRAANSWQLFLPLFVQSVDAMLDLQSSSRRQT